MLQQCWSAGSCMWMHIVMEEDCTECRHSLHFVLNGPMQFCLLFCSTLLTLLWSLVAWIPSSALFSLPEDSCHQLPGRQTVV
jgi:hypothetical protein